MIQTYFDSIKFIPAFINSFPLFQKPPTKGRLPREVGVVQYRLRLARTIADAIVAGIVVEFWAADHLVEVIDQPHLDLIRQPEIRAGRQGAEKIFQGGFKRHPVPLLPRLGADDVSRVVAHSVSLVLAGRGRDSSPAWLFEVRQVWRGGHGIFDPRHDKLRCLWRDGARPIGTKRSPLHLGIVF